MKHRIQTSIVCAVVALFSGCTTGPSPDATQKRPVEPPKPSAVGSVLRTATDGNQASGFSVKRAAASKEEPAQANLPLFPGDTLRCGPKDTAALLMTGGLSLTLNADTMLVLKDPNSLSLQKGEIWVDTVGEAVIETSRGKVQVSGGKGTVRIVDDGTTVSWVSGKATFESKGTTLALVGGDEARADASGVRKTVIKDPAALTAWTERVRAAVASGQQNGNGELSPSPSGLGTLTAKAPGGSRPLPFQIIAEDVQVRIRGNMAVTRVEQIFQNPTNQVVEADYRFPIPENAVLTGYDMEINGRMMRGEIVERERGRKIMKKVIDDYLYLMRDPALTEWESGSTFKTRIFPIQPKEQKRIVLTHLMPLSGAQGTYRYVLPVSLGRTDSPAIPKFRIQADISSDDGSLPRVETPLYASRLEPSEGAVRATFEAAGFVPRADFVLTVEHNDFSEASLAVYAGTPEAAQIASAAPTVSAGSLIEAPIPSAFSANVEHTFLLRLGPNLENPEAVQPPASDWLFLVDTSESRFGPDMEIQKRLLSALVDVLGPEDRVKVVGFDTFPVKMGSAWAAPSAELKTQIEQFFSDVEPGGATQLEGALFAAKEEMDDTRPLKVVVLSDGSATLGETAPGRLADLAASLFPYPSSVSAVGIGSSIDSLLLQTLTRRTGGRYFTLSSGEDLFTAAVRVAVGLRSPVLENPLLSINGVAAEDLVPETLPNLAAGEELLIAGKFRGTGKLTAALSGTLGRRAWRKEWTFEATQGSAKNGFVPAVWASEKINALTRAGTEAADREIVSLSKKFGVASRLTSFIVLENNAMYKEFKVERSAPRPHWDGSTAEETEAESSFMPESAFEGGAEAEAEDDSSRPSAPKSPPPAAEKKSAPAKRSAPFSSSKGAPSKHADSTNSDGGYAPWDYDDYNSHRVYNTVRYVLSVRPLAAVPSAQVIEKANALDAAVQNAPLDRRARRDLVRYLIQNRMVQEAAKALSAWSALDRSNPEVHLAFGDLYRLEGKLNKALRAYSSVLDLQPESKKVFEFLAAVFESQSRFTEALPFVTSLSNLKSKDDALKVRKAVVAFKANRIDEAVRICRDLTGLDVSGLGLLKPGVKLSKTDTDTVMSIAMNRSLPLLYDSAAAAGLSSAGFKMTLTWDAPADVVLWVSTAKEKFLGGAFGKARLIADHAARRQVFFVTGGGDGLYRIDVLCASAAGCENLTGRLTAEFHGKKKVVPISLNGTAPASAVVRAEKQILPI